MAGAEDRNDRTLFVGNVERSCTEEILFELFLQGGPLEGVKIAKEKDGASKGYAFIEYKHDISVPYALHLFTGTSLFGRQLSLKFRNGSKHEQNQYQGPPPQAFPKGFPEQANINDPPPTQRLQLPPPYSNRNPDMPAAGSMWPLPPPNGSVNMGHRGSPVPHSYGSPYSPREMENFYGGSQRRHFEQTFGNEEVTSSRSPHWESPPVLRETSPRWSARHHRGENEYHESESQRSHGSGHDRSGDRRHHDRSQQLHRSRSYGGGHNERDDRYQPREEERSYRGRERSRTSEENFRGYGGGHHRSRDRSLDDRHRDRHRGNDGQRPHHYR